MSLFSFVICHSPQGRSPPCPTRPPTKPSRTNSWFSKQHYPKNRPLMHTPLPACSCLARNDTSRSRESLTYDLTNVLTIDRSHELPRKQILHLAGKSIGISVGVLFARSAADENAQRNLEHLGQPGLCDCGQACSGARRRPPPPPLPPDFFSGLCSPSTLVIHRYLSKSKQLVQFVHAASCFTGADDIKIP